MELSNYFYFTAVVGNESIKRMLTSSAVDPSIGVVLIYGPEKTMKERLVKAMCSINDTITGNSNTGRYIKKYHQRGPLEHMEHLKKISGVDYIILTDLESYQERYLDDLLESWYSDVPDDRSLILIYNGFPKQDGYSIDTDFKAEASPLSDIEHRMEMVSRERDHLMAPKIFDKKFHKLEIDLILRISRARQLLDKVNLAELLRNELRGRIDERYGLFEADRRYDSAVSYAKAEAAFNDNRWISADDMENALSYLSH